MELDIRKLNTRVISLKDSSHRKRIGDMLTDLGFENWSFFDAIKSTPHFSYLVGCSLSHRECLNQTELPCLVFEDDAALVDPENFNPVINIPDDSDMFYLGTSAWGLKTGASTLNGSEFERVNGDIYRVRHMTSGHAIVYLNEEKCRQMSYNSIKYMAETGKCYDESYGMQLKNMNAYCFETPVFYQDCKRNEIFTRFPVTTKYEVR